MSPDYSRYLIAYSLVSYWNTVLRSPYSTRKSTVSTTLIKCQIQRIFNCWRYSAYRVAKFDENSAFKMCYRVQCKRCGKATWRGTCHTVWWKYGIIIMWGWQQKQLVGFNFEGVAG